MTPAFALMVAVTGTWLSLLGNGPLWSEVAGGAEDGCRANWWSALLYVANYANPGRYVVGSRYACSSETGMDFHIATEYFSRNSGEGRRVYQKRSDWSVGGVDVGRVGE